MILRPNQKSDFLILLQITYNITHFFLIYYWCIKFIAINFKELPGRYNPFPSKDNSANLKPKNLYLKSASTMKPITMIRWFVISPETKPLKKGMRKYHKYLLPKKRLRRRSHLLTGTINYSGRPIKASLEDLWALVFLFWRSELYCHR